MKIAHQSVFQKYRFQIKNQPLKIFEASLKKVKSQVNTFKDRGEVSNQEKEFQKKKINKKKLKMQSLKMQNCNNEP